MGTDCLITSSQGGENGWNLRDMMAAQDSDCTKCYLKYLKEMILCSVNCFSFRFLFGHTACMWDLFPHQGQNQWPLQWKLSPNHWTIREVPPDISDTGVTDHRPLPRELTEIKGPDFKRSCLGEASEMRIYFRTSDHPICLFPLYVKLPSALPKHTKVDNEVRTQDNWSWEVSRLNSLF